jgi:hypothetical protein
MANQRRDEPVQVKKGMTGPARKAPTTEATAAKPSKAQLDARQERVRLKRRPGPPLGPGPESRAQAESQQNVPPTDCDDEGEQ